MLTRKQINRIKEALDNWYGLQVPCWYLKDLFVRFPAIADDIEKMSFDTCARETTIGAIANDMGLGKWPMGGDSESYATAFFLLFDIECKKREFGFHLEGYVKGVP